MPVSYAEVCEAYEAKKEFCGVAEDDESLYGTEEDLYAEVLQLLEVKYLEDRFSMCIEIRDGDRVVYAFPKLACPELFIERLKIDTRKL